MKQIYARQIKKVLLSAIIMVLSLTMVIVFSSCSEKPETVTVAEVPAAGSFIPYIAEEKGFFSQNGLEVTLKTYDSGPTAVNALMKGEVDLTPSGEFPIVGLALQKASLSIIGTDTRNFLWYVIGRKDHGIENISDLKGKKVAIQRQSLGEFYLGRSLDLHGLNIKDVTLVNTNPAQWVDVISNSSVDAVVVFDFYLNQIKSQVGNEAVIWSAQENQPSFTTISGRADWVTQHPDTVKRFLKALDVSQI